MLDKNGIKAKLKGETTMSYQEILIDGFIDDVKENSGGHIQKDSVLFLAPEHPKLQVLKRDRN